MKVCFATNNPNKIQEVQQLLAATGRQFDVVSLTAIGCHEELPENQTTIEGNAIEKASYVFTNYGVNCFADDTGLEVTALNGAPGVYSARYAGPQRDARQNMELLLRNLAGNSNRQARFKTVVCLYLNGQQYTFEGIAEGHIIDAPRGAGGFGYDPVFVPTGHTRTFAEMSGQEKNTMSHRAKAVQKLIDYLQKAAI